MFEKSFFVLSPSYHGATLLSKLINAHPEVTALGDTYPSNEYDQTCGCGEQVSVCSFWQAVKADVGVDEYKKARLMLPRYPGERGGCSGRLLFSDFTSFWAMPSLLSMLRGRYLPEFRQKYEDFLAAVYRHTLQPGRIFVDGVKFNSRLAALVASGFPVNGIIHLYRDPVSFVVSSTQNTGRGGWSGTIEHALRYRLYHARARQVEQLVPTLNLGYETMADDIDAQLERLFEFLGVEPMELSRLRENFNQEWHFMGNASLFQFDGEIRRARREVSPAKRVLIHRVAGFPPVLGEGS